MNLSTKQSYRCRKQTYDYWRVSRGRLGLTYISYYIKYIINKDPLYSTGNSTQYSVMAYMGKYCKKKCGYMYKYNRFVLLYS